MLRNGWLLDSHRGHLQVVGNFCVGLGLLASGGHRDGRESDPKIKIMEVALYLSLHRNVRNVRSRAADNFFRAPAVPGEICWAP